jgi:alkylation response protein AidB-like acyl-CoA dehydrogenase
MHFAFTDEQAMIAETVQGFFAEHATSERTRKAMAGEGIDRALWQAFCAELGLAGIGVAEDLGGAGLGMVEFAIVAEAAGSQVAAVPLLGHAMAARAITAGGSAAQQSEWLPGMLSSEVIAACSGSNSVTAAGNTLSGIYQFVAHGAVADLFVLRAGAGLWIVRADAPGITVTAETTMDQTRPFATVTLEAAPGDPLSDSTAGLQAAHEAGWICAAAEALGVAQAALARTVDYAKERVQFGRPIGSFQAYKHRLADMVIEIEQARSAVYWAACAVDEGSDEAELALHAAKSFAADTAFMCAGNMIQLHGGIGFTWEHDAHLYFKRARALQSMLGSGDLHREQIAAKVLGEAA